MATYEIPVAPSVADQKFKVVLEEETFSLRCRWNASAAQWMLYVGDTLGDIIVAMPMVLGIPFLAQRKSTRLPKGELVCIDTSSQDEEAGLADLGARVKLIYIDSTGG